MKKVEKILIFVLIISLFFLTWPERHIKMSSMRTGTTQQETFSPSGSVFGRFRPVLVLSLDGLFLKGR